MKIVWAIDDIGAGQRAARKTVPDDAYLITHSPLEEDWNLVNLNDGRYLVYGGTKKAMADALTKGDFWPVEFLEPKS